MKDGFTLVELLIVIAILGVLLTIAVPSVLNSFKEANIKACNIQREAVVDACENYVKDKVSSGENINNGSKVTLKKIIEDRYISEPIHNEVKKELYSRSNSFELTIKLTYQTVDSIQIIKELSCTIPNDKFICEE